MKMDYVSRIKKNIAARQSIYASNKTTRILDGSYLSIYKGRSMNFDDLREYQPGDDIKDIDWKATARSRTTLIREYIAEKKHNVMLVMDTDLRMLGNTSVMEEKTDVALMSAGAIACFAQRNGDYVGAIYPKENSFELYPLKSDIYSIEQFLAGYDRDSKRPSKKTLDETLNHIVNTMKRRMVVFIYTDLKGISQVSEKTLKKLAFVHNVLVTIVDDVEIYGKKTFVVEKDEYLPDFITKDKKLAKIEKLNKEVALDNVNDMLNKNKISYVTISSTKDINKKMIELLEKHRYGITHQ